MRVLALVAILVTAAAVAHAQPTAPIGWSAPDECPTEAQIVAEVERLLGGVNWSLWRSLGAEIAARPDADAWVVEVRTANPPGERTLRGATCDEVAAAAALIIAMTIDPDFVPPDQQPDPEPPPAPSPRVVSPPSVVIAPEVKVPILWTFGGGIGGGGGALPGVGPGVGVTVAGARGPWRAEVGGAYFFARREELPDRDGVGVDVSLLIGTLRACRSQFSLDGCLGAEAGITLGEGQAAVSRTQRSAWVAPVGSVGRSFKVTESFGVRVVGEVAAPLRRARFQITLTGPPPAGDQVVDVYQAAVVVGRLWVGAEIRFP